MRGLVGLVIVGILAVGATLYFTVGGGSSDSDDHFTVAVGFGKAPGGAYQVHVGVEFTMTRIEGMKLKGKGSTKADWVEEHLTLEDKAGTKIPLTWTNNSKLLSTQAQGTWDFFAYAPAKPGESYVLTYKPHRDEALSYRKEFKTSTSGNDMVRLMLDKVE
jgi:hypothetical protein